MPYLNTSDGTALFFRDWGSGDPVVFVHGWGLNSDMWEYQLPYRRLLRPSPGRSSRRRLPIGWTGRACAGTPCATPRTAGP